MNKWYGAKATKKFSDNWDRIFKNTKCGTPECCMQCDTTVPKENTVGKQRIGY